MRGPRPFQFFVMQPAHCGDALGTGQVPTSLSPRISFGESPARSLSSSVPKKVQCRATGSFESVSMLVILSISKGSACRPAGPSSKTSVVVAYRTSVELLDAWRTSSPRGRMTKLPPSCSRDGAPATPKSTQAQPENPIGSRYVSLGPSGGSRVPSGHNRLQPTVPRDGSARTRRAGTKPLLTAVHP